MDRCHADASVLSRTAVCDSVVTSRVFLQPAPRLHLQHPAQARRPCPGPLQWPPNCPSGPSPTAVFDQNPRKFFRLGLAFRMKVKHLRTASTVTRPAFQPSLVVLSPYLALFLAPWPSRIVVSAPIVLPVLFTSRGKKSLSSEGGGQIQTVLAVLVPTSLYLFQLQYYIHIYGCRL